MSVLLQKDEEGFNRALGIDGGLPLGNVSNVNSGRN